MDYKFEERSIWIYVDWLEFPRLESASLIVIKRHKAKLSELDFI